MLLFFFQDVDEFFESEKVFLVDYYTKIKDSTMKADKMTRTHKSNTATFLAYLDISLSQIDSNVG